MKISLGASDTTPSRGSVHPKPQDENIDNRPSCTAIIADDSFDVHEIMIAEQNPKDKDDNSIIDVKVGLAAAVGTAGLIHDAVRFEDSTSGALVLEAGAALLEAFEHVPFVAPAAFLIVSTPR